MNLFFLIRRAKLLFYMRKKLISSKEDYFAFLKKCAEEYKPQTLVVKDATAEIDADCNVLFCKIDAHRDLAERFGFPFSSERSDKENALAIMRHLTEHTHYCGYTKNILPDDGAEILQNSFNLPFEKALNCRSKAIALTDVLNAVGIKALPVCATAESGCHFLVHVWLKEENRFIVLDPSFNCSFHDESGKALSVFALRDSIIQHRTVRIDGYAFLGTDAFKDYYFSAFVSDVLENIATWKTNQRGKKEMSKVCGAAFHTRVPRTL